MASRTQRAVTRQPQLNGLATDLDNAGNRNGQFEVESASLPYEELIVSRNGTGRSGDTADTDTGAWGSEDPIRLALVFRVEAKHWRAPSNSPYPN